MHVRVTTYPGNVPASASPRQISRSLAAYLCGTHSGLLSLRRRDRLDVEQLARVHADLPNGKRSSMIGALRWKPADEAMDLALALRAALERPGVADLVLFGSQVRGGLTGFSDVDALLVIEDDIAEDPRSLKALRPDVLAAQRAVIAYQPMQHHAFEVATPKLLAQAAESLGMPAIAFDEARSLLGAGASASFAPDPPERARGRLAQLLAGVSSEEAWPQHPWRLHGLVAMWELAPALYVQALGEPVAKALSFERARGDFGDAWWPYDVLEQVREQWVRSSQSMFVATSRALRNPWIAVAVWMRMPVAGRQPAQRLLSDECLTALRGLAREMTERAG
jgi:nucleotidyltransferase-like protein